MRPVPIVVSKRRERPGLPSLVGGAGGLELGSDLHAARAGLRIWSVVAFGFGFGSDFVFSGRDSLAFMIASSFLLSSAAAVTLMRLPLIGPALMLMRLQ